MQSGRAYKLDNKSVFISCVVPVFNEEAVIQSFIEALKNTLAELTQHF